jgi:hypothetical protein
VWSPGPCTARPGRRHGEAVALGPGGDNGCCSGGQRRRGRIARGPAQDQQVIQDLAPECPAAPFRSGDFDSAERNGEILGKGRSAVPGPSGFRVSGVVRLADVDTARLCLSARTRQHTGADGRGLHTRAATQAPTSCPTCPSSRSAACARTGSCSATPARATAARAVGSPASTGVPSPSPSPSPGTPPTRPPPSPPATARPRPRPGTGYTPASAKQPARVSPRRPGLRGSGRRRRLKQRRRTLQHVTLSPSRIGDIARAALVLNEHWK